MSNTKSVEQQLKEAIEASKQTLALSEQVTSLAQEKETLSKRLAEIETSLSAPKAETPVAVDPLVIAKLGELLAEREVTAKAMKALSEQTAQALALAARLEKEAAKKADLNEYVKQKVEDGEEGNTPAEKINNSGKGAKKGEMPQFIKDKIEEKEEAETEAEDQPYHPSPGMRNEAKKGKKAEMPDFIKEKIEESEEESEEACDYKGKKGKAKAAKAYGDEDMELSEDELEMLKEYRQASKAKSKKADSTLKNPLKEEKKDFGDIIPQPGLDPEKNNVNEDNTTSPKISKKAAKATKKGETDVEEIMESPDMQKEEGEEHEHEVTLSKPGKGAKKAEEAALEAVAAKKGAETSEEIPPAIMEYLQQMVDEEKAKAKAKKGENSLPGMNKKDVVGQPDQDEEESFLKKDGKKAETVEKCVKDNCADDTTKVHEDGCAPTKGNTTPVGDLAPLAKGSLDSVVDVAVERLAQVAKAKQAVEAELAKKNETLAFEIKAKDEAMTAVAQLQAKFEAMMTKLSQAQAADNALEAKAAKIVAASASEPVSAEIQGEAPKTDADFLAQFEAIADKREQNRFFKAHAAAISRAAQANLKARRS
jgi:hypothetical protein